MSASSVSDSCLTVVSSVCWSRDERGLEPLRLGAVAGAHLEDVVDVGVQLVEVATQRGAVAGLQVVDRVAQNVEQLAVAGRLAVAEDVATDDVDRHRDAGADLADDARDRRVEAAVVAVVGVVGAGRRTGACPSRRRRRRSCRGRSCWRPA